MTETDLRSLLEGVPKSYPAFVDGILADARDFGTNAAIARFVKEHPDATAGDVCEFSTKLAGLI